MAGERILILDGDSIAYRCAAAGEKRFIRVLHEPTGKEKIFKTRTEFKTHMQSKDKDITSDYSISDDREISPVENILQTIKQHITRIENAVEPDKTIIYAGESNNFRLNLPLPSKYKGNREDVLRPFYLTEAKEYLKRKYKAESAFGYEVDDACSIAAYSALESGNEAIMYFYEKDQYQLDGVTLLYDEPSDFRLEIVPEVGSLRLDKKAVKGLGLKFLCQQWCGQDVVDNYKANEASGIRFGDKSVYDFLNPLDNPKDILEGVVELFKKYYPEPLEYKVWDGTSNVLDWRGMMEMYYKCARMKRYENDPLDCYMLFDHYGVTV